MTENARTQMTDKALSTWLAKPVGKSVVVGIIAFLVFGIFDSALLGGFAAGGAYLGFEWVKEIILKIFRAIDNKTS